MRLSYYRARYYDSQAGRFLNEDPIGFMGGKDFYTYVRNNPTGFIDPTGLQTTIIIVYDNGPGGIVFGSHAALYIDNGGSPVLYDPGGSYAEDHHCGSGDSCTEPDTSSVPRFKRYHSEDPDFRSIDIFVFDTTPREEERIAERIESLGGAPGGLCARNVSNAIKGIGPFKNIQTTWWPGNLGRQLNGLQPPPRGGGGGGAW